MKKFTLLNLFTIILAIFVIFFTIPAFAWDYAIESGNGHLNTGNANGQGGVINQGTMNTGDTYSGTMKKGINDNNVDIKKSFNYRSNNVNKSKTYNIDVDIDKSKTDNSILKNADLRKSQNGLINQKGKHNQQGLLNIKGNKNQMGLVNQAGHHNTQIVGGSGMYEGGDAQGQEQDQKQKQQQGQLQGQMQGQTAHNEGVEQSVIVEGDSLIIEAAETKRDHHTGTAVTFASLGAYAESRFAGANFQTVEMMTKFKDVFSYEGALEVYGKPFGRGLCETTGKSYNGRHEDDPSESIKVYTLDDKIIPGSVEAIGFLTIIGKEGKGATSFIVMQKAILSAAIMQGDAILVTKQGAETVTKSSGWGIGFNTSGSQINDNDHGRGNSYAGSGGTGWSTGKGKLEVLPWMIVQVLKFK